jgi:uncharacterized membrane protein YdcZ (DUF606 family)
MQDITVARWRIVGFYILFAALPIATAAAAIAVAVDAPRWSLAAAICAAALGGLVGIAVGRLPPDATLPPWAFTAGLAGACFVTTALSSVADDVAAVVRGFAAGLLAVTSSSLIVRRKRHPETFHRQAS